MNKNSFKDWMKANGYTFVDMSKILAKELNDEKYLNPDRLRNMVYGKVLINNREIKALIKIGVEKSIFS